MTRKPPTLVHAYKKVADAAMLNSLCACACAVFLALCIWRSDPWWGYAAVAASLVGVAAYVADRLIRRRRQAGSRIEPADAEPEAAIGDAAEAGDAAEVTPADAAGPADPPEVAETVTVAEAPPAAKTAPAPAEDDGIVATIPGRRRYHVVACDLLRDHEYEEITMAEARAEGFTPCTACFKVGSTSIGRLLSANNERS